MEALWCILVHAVAANSEVESRFLRSKAHSQSISIVYTKYYYDIQLLVLLSTISTYVSTSTTLED